MGIKLRLKNGVDEQKRRENQPAADYFHEAAQIDDEVAELHFHVAGCALALGAMADAQ